MTTVTFTYDLEESEDDRKFRIHCNMEGYAGVLSEVKDKLRSIRKYSHGYSDEQVEGFEAFEEWFFEVLDDYNIKIQD